jgi:hypothetical protein
MRERSRPTVVHRVYVDEGHHDYKVGKLEAKRIRKAAAAGHVVYNPKIKESVERVRPHTDPMRALMGEPAPGQSALDKKIALAQDAA